ncbi:MAG: hypothetical protein ACK6DZ_19745 [Acidobacteriota bacterium]
MALFLAATEDAMRVVVTAWQCYLRQGLFRLAPFRRQLPHPPQYFQLPVDTRDGEFASASSSGRFWRSNHLYTSVLALLAKRDLTNGARSLSMHSRNIGTGFWPRTKSSAFPGPVLGAASICPAAHLCGCFVLARIWHSRRVNLYYQFFAPFCL